MFILSFCYFQGSPPVVDDSQADKVAELGQLVTEKDEQLTKLTEELISLKASLEAEIEATKTITEERSKLQEEVVILKSGAGDQILALQQEVDVAKATLEQEVSRAQQLEEQKNSLERQAAETSDRIAGRL